MIWCNCIIWCNCTIWCNCVIWYNCMIWYSLHCYLASSYPLFRFGEFFLLLFISRENFFYYNFFFSFLFFSFLFFSFLFFSFLFFSFLFFSFLFFFFSFLFFSFLTKTRVSFGVSVNLFVSLNLYHRGAERRRAVQTRR